MDNFKRVEYSDANNHLLNNFGCIVLIKIIVIFNKLIKIFSFDKFRYDVDMCFGLNTLFELE